MLDFTLAHEGVALKERTPSVPHFYQEKVIEGIAHRANSIEAARTD